MVAEIHAEYKRVFQVKPYETETIVLSVTDTVDPDTEKHWKEDNLERSEGLATMSSEYYKHLAEIGDQVMKERLDSRRVPF